MKPKRNDDSESLFSCGDTTFFFKTQWQLSLFMSVSRLAVRGQRLAACNVMVQSAYSVKM